MLDQTYYKKADEIISQHGLEPASLIPIIQDIQSEYRYLPPELLRYVAKKLGINEAKAYSVATFYENFSFEPRESTLLKSVMELPVMSESQFRFWNGFIVNLDFQKKRRQRTICYLHWRQFPVLERADLLRF